MLIAYFGLSIIPDGLPRTLQFQIDEWHNQSWGFHDIFRRRIRCEVAVASDGSRMNRCEQELFHHYFIPNGHRTEHGLYLRSANSAFQIDHSTRTAHGGTCHCAWEPPVAPADDGECRRTAAVHLWEGKRTGTGYVSGHRVVRYRSVDWQGMQIELSLAPGLGCEVMEEVHTSPGTLGIPGAKWRYRVSSYKPGEPDSSVFRLPAGYSVQQRSP